MGRIAQKIQKSGAESRWRDVEERRRRRAWHLFFLFAAFNLVLLGRLGWLTVEVRREQKLAPQSMPSGRTLLIPGRRGSIYAADGRRLAWSKPCLQLTWHLPTTALAASQDLAMAGRIPEVKPYLPMLAELDENLGKELLLASDLPCPDEKLALVLAMLPARFQCQATFQRLQITEGLPPERLGKVVIDSATGLEVGVSGLELKHDQQLRGKLLQVQVDADDQWGGLNESTKLEEQGSGEDVFLDAAELAAPD